MTDIEALDSCGRLGEVENIRELREHLLHALLLRQAHAQALRCVVLCELDPFQTQATRGSAYPNGSARPCAECLRQRFLILQRATQQNLRRGFLRRVVLHDE